MEWNVERARKRLVLLSAIILLVGLSSAGLIYLTAGNGPDSGPDFENSKIYLHDLELYGGKANVLANEFRNWFAGLWQGKSLAYTVVSITLVMAFGFFFVARHSPPDSKTGHR